MEDPFPPTPVEETSECANRAGRGGHYLRDRVLAGGSRAMTDRSAMRFARTIFWVTAALFVVAVVWSVANFAPNKPSGWDTGEVLSGDLLLAAMFCFSVVGVLIASRQPRNAIGWILLAIGLVWELSTGVTENYNQYGLVTRPGSLPGQGLVIALTAWSWVPGVGLIGTFLVLLFPDGHLPSPRWRPLAWLAAVAMVLASLGIMVWPGDFGDSGFPQVTNPLGIQALRPVIGVTYVFIALIPLSMVGCAAGLIQRFRRSHTRERLQLKWLAAAAGTTAAVYLVTMVFSITQEQGWFSRSTPAWLSVLQIVAIYSFVLVPVAVGIAILRYRLYDIDVIINRALVYGALTATLAAVYLGVVVALGAVLRSVTDRANNNLAVAASTLAVAALFRPARARIQSFIDRRFYRRKYDAAQTLESFSVRLRDEIDLESLTVELQAVVRQTMQPTHVSLWLRSPRA
jgi:hypothetical protein